MGAKDNTQYIKDLINAGASLEAKDNVVKWTPLYCAAYVGRVDVVKALLEAGASTKATDESFWTPLHIAAYRGHVATVKALIAAGSDINAKDIHGKIPWDWANSEVPWKCQELNPNHTK